MELITADALDSPARVDAPVRSKVRVAVVQHAWRADAAARTAVLDEAVEQAAQARASIVFMPELTLSRYPAFELPVGVPAEAAE